MKKLLSFLTAILFLAACEPENSTQTVTENPEKEVMSPSENQLNKNFFKSETFPISFNFPPNWEIMEDTNMSMIHVISPTNETDNFQEMVNIVIGGTRGKDLDAFFDGNLYMIQNMFAELNQTEEQSYQTINEVKFKKVRYNYLIEGLPLTAQLYVTIQNNTSYIINCSALQNTFDEYQEEFTSIMNSLAIR